MTEAATQLATARPAVTRPAPRLRPLTDKDVVAEDRRFKLPKPQASALPFSADDLKPLSNADVKVPKSDLLPLDARDFQGRTAAGRRDAMLRELGALSPTARNLQAAKRPLAAEDFIPGARVKTEDPHERITKQAQKWVAQTFYGTLLKQMHNSPFRSELFDGGRGGQAFATLRDQQLADRMSRSAGNKLVRAIVKRVEANAAYRKQGKVGGGANASGPQAQEQDNAASAIPKNQGRYKDVKIHVAPALRT